ncbi:hypothetical protein H2200_007698 [Cladophialophora chaetospira]|uniref:Heterokaryon incompatibility domain-containing protein n=1 Tax=Cladophialophora chaetospira TaxID=386627 RepID=A0AA38X684_9EURO|nr:hypothetical protein H2200_007698 [Cladophialophora chaetospira]
MSSQAEYFRYTPLNLAQQSFRLINVLSRAPDGEIRCFMYNTFHQQQYREFTALSYEWGNRPVQFRIWINVIRFPVRPNLYSFFQHLSTLYPAGYDRLWIDALCIDQNNVKERNHQVSIMKNTYESAGKTLVWLGPNANGSDTVFHLLEKEFERRRRSGMLTEVPDTIVEQETMFDSTCIEKAGDDRRLKEMFRATTVRKYWERTWILQELVVSTSPILMCGTRMCPWSFWTAAMIYIDINWGFKNPYPLEIWKLKASKREAPTIEFTNLVRLLLHFRQSDCKDLHDKAYALVGLAGTGSQVPIDYRSTLETLYGQLVDVIDPRSSTPILDALDLALIFRVEPHLWSLFRFLSPYTKQADYEALLYTIPAEWDRIFDHLRQRWEMYGAPGVCGPGFVRECRTLYRDYYDQQ